MYLVLSIIGQGEQGASHAFDRAGGVIGRSRSCDWVLNDPSKTISARHASISFAEGSFFITDTSTNGTFLNGSPTPIGKGGAAPLRAGDRLAIGGFTIAVELADRPDGRAGGHQASGAVLDGAAMGPRPAAIPAAGGDVLSGLATPGAGRSNALLDEFQTAPRPAGQAGRHHGTAAALDDLVGGTSGGRTGEDFARSARTPGAAAPPQMPAGSSNGGAAYRDAPATAQPAPIPDHLSVDYLLSGRPPASQDAAPSPQAVQPPPAPPSPLPDNPPVEARPAMVPPARPQADPPQQTAAAPAPPPADELSPDLRASYVALGSGTQSPPEAEGAAAIDPVTILRQRSEGRERARTAPVAGAPSPRPAAAAMPDPAPRPRQAPPAAPVAPAPSGAPAPSEAARPAMPPAGAPEPQEGQEPAGDEALAFWRGLGVDPGNVPPERRAELLVEVGRAVREIGQGLVEVLAARRSIKDEFRMDQTRLQASENNPFKFFSSGEKALARVIVGEAGYLPLDEAVRESLQDIKAHEVAAMAALQSAVSHVLSELDPEAMGQGNVARGAFGRGIDKKALWDRFVERHRGLADDIEGTAKSVVTNAFMEAYERQLSRMRGD